MYRCDINGSLDSSLLSCEKEISQQQQLIRNFDDHLLAIKKH